MAKQLKVKPIGGKILVAPEKAEEKTKSGIYLPDSATKEKPQTGTIVALGSGKVTPDGKSLSFNVSVGDKIIFKKYAPDTVEVDGEEYLIMEEEDILAVLS